ncbi:hypothetical protein CLOLEP_00661 [[Clostridium] leptum DSM 753]|uniref:Uncharacterized protein n=1 Tax=[Clostridium] leptum DSM 753 TaxID=428125 RepID=A7VQ34_9FIRM|nr:hypothetical protein CLOLEP_00661 [[Clostridium] leptum DSM 753]
MKKQIPYKTKDVGSEGKILGSLPFALCFFALTRKIMHQKFHFD